MIRKTFVWILATLFLTTVSPAQAQQPKIPRIGFLSSTDNRFSFEQFRLRIRDRGHIEGKNIVIEYRTAEARQDRIPGLVAELVQLKVDVLVSTSQRAIEIAKQATKTIPIVIVINADPVATGIVDSLARPGGNITGISTLQRELSGKRLELLKETVPRISRVGVLWNPDSSGPAISFKEYEAAAGAIKLRIQSLEVRGPKPDFGSAFQAAVKERAGGLIVISNSLLNQHQKPVADFAIKNRLPSMYERGDYVDAGGFMSYSANEAENYRRAAYYVDRILKGAKPADLPVEQPMKFDFVINLNTAKQIGVTIPQWTLMKADRVIR
jgi:putative ABC transport system substrate-binding protein